MQAYRQELVLHKSNLLDSHHQHAQHRHRGSRSYASDKACTPLQFDTTRSECQHPLLEDDSQCTSRTMSMWRTRPQKACLVELRRPAVIPMKLGLISIVELLYTVRYLVSICL